jgi:hypothetical protein
MQKIGLKTLKKSSMKKIPTAEKYLQGSETYDKDYPTISLYDAEQRMIEFAKLHVAAALKEASEKAKASLGKDWIRTEETIHPGQLVDTIIIKVDKDSILNSYPLTNIK